MQVVFCYNTHMSALQLKNFSKHFGGVKAVSGVTCGFEKGKITGLIGPNGSGKSTLINLMTGIVPKDHGVLIISDSVRVDTIRPHDMREYKMTRTFQNVRVFEQMSVLDNVMLALTHRSVWKTLFERNSQVYVDRASDILKVVGLSEKQHEQAVNLSYGQRKLLEIARAVAMDADIILFDEPYAGLFPEMIKKVSDILRGLRTEGRAVVLVEHNMEIIRDLCDHIIVMDSGEVLAQGDPTTVLARRDVVEAYLGE